MFAVILVLVGQFANATALNFHDVNAQALSGFSAETSEFQRKVREDASAFAYYRRYQESTRGKEIRSDCAESRESNLFCDVIAQENDKPVLQTTSKETRAKFFQTLMSLDAQAGRVKACPAAKTALTKITEDQEAYSLHIRANYWLWVCASTLADQTEADRISQLMSKRFPLAYHTLLILQHEQSGRLDEIFESDPQWTVKFRSDAIPEINPWIAGIEALMEQKEDGAAAVFGAFINPKLYEAEPELRLYMAILMARVSASVPSTLPVARVLVPLFQQYPEYLAQPALRLLFPNDYSMAGADTNKRFVFHELVSEHHAGVDANLLKGLIHQESALNPRATSSAGAVGLTQMLLGTATDQWRKMSKDKNVEVTAAMLREPDFSIKLGAADFKRRLEGFSNKVTLAVASYNAGETGVRNWLKEVKPINDPQILADLLFMNRGPESHVPQYVSAVLSKKFWYSRLYPQRALP